MRRPKLLKIASLWLKNSQGAGDYFTGVAGDVPPRFVWEKGTRLMIFANREPSSPVSPTHYLMTPAPEEEKKEDKEPPADW